MTDDTIQRRRQQCVGEQVAPKMLLGASPVTLTNAMAGLCFK